MGYEQEIIKVRFDKQMLKEFSGYDVEDDGESYYKAHPRAKKPPYDNIWKKGRNGLIPSINSFLNCHDRGLQNDWERHLKDYCTYCLKAQKIPAAYFSECIIVAIQFKPTKTKSDVNNIYTKPFIDAMVKYELLAEDNYTVVRLHQEYAVVDKQDPRTEIRIYPIIGDYTFSQVIEYVANDIKYLENMYEEV